MKMNNKMITAIAVFALALAFIAFAPASNDDAAVEDLTISSSYVVEEGDAYVIVGFSKDIAAPTLSVSITAEATSESVYAADVESKLIEDHELVIGLSSTLSDGLYKVEVSASPDYAMDIFQVGEIPTTTYTIAFVADGKMVDTQTVEEGEMPVVPEVPTKEGFIGEWTPTVAVATEDFTYLAKYTEIPAGKSVVAFAETDGIVYTIDGAEYVEFEKSVDNGTVFTFSATLLNGYRATTDFAVTVNGDAIEAFEFDEDYTVTVTSDVTVVVEGVEKIQYKDTVVTGEYSSTNIFDDTQIVTVKDSWTLMSGANVEIYGKLVVPEGTTLIVDSDAMLYIMGEAEIDGMFIINEYVDNGVVEGGYVYFGGETNVSGTIEVSGYADVGADATVQMNSGSEIIVQTTGIFATDEDSDMTIGAGAVFTVYGVIDIDEVQNNGTIIIDSMEPIVSSVITMGEGAVVDVVKMTVKEFGALSMTDSAKNGVGLAVKSTPIDVTDLEDKSAYCAGIFTGLKVSEIKENKALKMVVEGNFQVTYEYISTGSEDLPDNLSAEAAVVFSGANAVIVSDSVYVGENVTLANVGKLLVTGVIDATSGKFVNETILDAQPAVIDVVEDGLIMVKSQINSEVGINATRYSVGTGVEATICYVNIDAALASVQDKMTLTVLGTQTVTKSATLVSGAKLNVADATLVVGDKRDVTLTIAQGASVIGTPVVIDVQGTLFAEKYTDIASTARNKISCDVESSQLDENGQKVRDGWMKWTNVYTALENAEFGETIALKRELTVTENITIPEGVTLDTNAQDVTVNPGVTVTVDGVLDIDSNSKVVMDSATDKKDAADIVLHGDIKSDKAIAIKTDKGENFTVAGAYYTITEKKKTTYYIEPVADAAAIITMVDDYSIVIMGKNPVIDDVVFAGETDTSDKKEHKDVFVFIETNVSTGTLSLSRATIYVEDGCTFNGVITDGEGTVTVNAVADGIMGFRNFVDDKGVQSFEICGGFEDFSAKKPMTLIFDGVVAVTWDASFDRAVVDGTLNVKEDAMISVLTVNGTVFVDNEIELDVEKLIIENDGAVTVADKTDDKNAGLVVVAVLLAGVDENGRALAAAPALTGNFVIDDYGLFAPGVTIPESISKDADLNCTVFYGEDDIEYITAYAVDLTTGTIAQIELDVVNAWFGGWTSVKGDEFAIVDEMDALGEYDKVYAYIDYYIYHVIIIADYGVQNIAVDGKILPTPGLTNTFAIDLMAGEHTVTATTVQGYKGDAKLSMDGKALSGNKFTATGTPETEDGIFINLQLDGVESTGNNITINVDPADPIIEKESNDWTITTFLLLALVILIGVMIIVLLLRLRRS